MHVFDPAPPQWAHGLVGHGDAPVLSEGCEPLISRQDVPLRYRLGRVASRSKLPRERFIPTAPKSDSFWDSQIRRTLTRCFLFERSGIDGSSDFDHPA